jgi:hypothetical protein
VGWWVVNTDTPGAVRIECIIFGAGLHVTGPGNMLNLTFTAGSGDYTELAFSATQLYDTIGEIIPNVTSTNGSIIIGTSPAYIKAKCLLEGPYTAGSMTTNINGILPLSSPYNSAPFTVTSIPVNVVDWVLVELRSTFNGAAVKAQSAWLYSDGFIKSPGKPYLIFMNTNSASYFMVISHRNHLSVMSHNAVSVAGSGVPSLIDYSILTNIYGHGGVVQKDNGICTMAAGDANSDSGVYPTDRNANWRLETGQSGYKSADFNLDGSVYPNDLNGYWRINSGMASSVPLPGL